MPEFIFYPAPATPAELFQNAVQLATASKWSYKNGDWISKRLVREWGLEEKDFRFIERKETQAFLTASDKVKVVLLAFRGTEKKKEDILTDIKFPKRSVPMGGEVHGGFWDALEEVYPDIVYRLLAAPDKLLTEGRGLWVAGHSLGAALATLFTARFHHETQIKAQGVHTCGSPRVGDEDFVRNFDRLFTPLSCRFDNYRDPVPMLPPETLLGFDHVDRYFYFDKDGNLDETKVALAAVEKRKGLSEDQVLKAMRQGVRVPLFYLPQRILSLSSYGVVPGIGFKEISFPLNLWNLFLKIVGLALKGGGWALYWILRFCRVNIDDHSIDAYLKVLKKNRKRFVGRAGGGIPGFAFVQSLTERLIQFFRGPR